LLECWRKKSSLFFSSKQEKMTARAIPAQKGFVKAVAQGCGTLFALSLFTVL
jgi:hypothetical protein